MQVSEQDLPAVSDAARAVVEQAKRAGVWVFGGDRTRVCRRSWSMGWHCDAKAPVHADRRRLPRSGWYLLREGRRWNGPEVRGRCRCARRRYASSPTTRQLITICGLCPLPQRAMLRRRGSRCPLQCLERAPVTGSRTPRPHARPPLPVGCGIVGTANTTRDRW